ncbi:unnamed protein product [Trichogramma brassicae]|uniref:Reverse transcriptase Ty1/copia-type domain-containing protein n=1 Tax=Trichogramma brassicae TaxID=86971 RepID=A0A6H5J752_9HYME|nr:unnamed protein product [Trichogramma brassicae]
MKEAHQIGSTLKKLKIKKKDRFVKDCKIKKYNMSFRTVVAIPIRANFPEIFTTPRTEAENATTKSTKILDDGSVDPLFADTAKAPSMASLVGDVTVKTEVVKEPNDKAALIVHQDRRSIHLVDNQVARRRRAFGVLCNDNKNDDEAKDKEVSDENDDDVDATEDKEVPIENDDDNVDDTEIEQISNENDDDVNDAEDKEVLDENDDDVDDTEDNEVPDKTDDDVVLILANVTDDGNDSYGASSDEKSATTTSTETLNDVSWDPAPADTTKTPSTASHISDITVATKIVKEIAFEDAKISNGLTLSESSKTFDAKFVDPPLADTDEAPSTSLSINDVPIVTRDPRPRVYAVSRRANSNEVKQTVCVQKSTDAVPASVSDPESTVAGIFWGDDKPGVTRPDSSVSAHFNDSNGTFYYNLAKALITRRNMVKPFQSLTPEDLINVHVHTGLRDSIRSCGLMTYAGAHLRKEIRKCGFHQYAKNCLGDALVAKLGEANDGAIYFALAYRAIDMIQQLLTKRTTQEEADVTREIAEQTYGKVFEQSVWLPSSGIREPIRDDDTLVLAASNTAKVPELKIDDIEVHANLAKTNQDPASYREAIQSEERERWTTAIQEELKSMTDNEVWTIIDKPARNLNGQKLNLIDSKWVFKKKIDEKGIEKFKARLVIRGFKDKNSYELKETYAPVSRLSTIRTALAVINKLNLDAVQLDVKTAFLNGNLEDEIYMEIPDGLEIEGNNRSKVCKLQRTIYGLKTSPKIWNQRFTAEVKKLGLEKDIHEPCLFTWRKEGKVALLVLYVDDIILASNCKQRLQEIKETLCNTFEMKDLGEPSRYLGMEITRDRENRVMKLTQVEYTNKVLERFRMDESKAQNTPMVTRQEHERESGAAQHIRRSEYVGAEQEETRVDLNPTTTVVLQGPNEQARRSQQPPPGRAARQPVPGEAQDQAVSNTAGPCHKLFSARSRRATIVTSAVGGSGLSLRDHVARHN